MSDNYRNYWKPFVEEFYSSQFAGFFLRMFSLRIFSLISGKYIVTDQYPKTSYLSASSMSKTDRDICKFVVFPAHGISISIVDLGTVEKYGMRWDTGNAVFRCFLYFFCKTLSGESKTEIKGVLIIY